MVGFEAIFRILGCVSIDLRSCGINERGECKVWINRNLSSNLPEVKKGILDTESQIINEILRLFRKMVQESSKWFFISLGKHIDLFERYFRLNTVRPSDKSTLSSADVLRQGKFKFLPF